MAIRTEISLKLQNSPGALGKVCQLLARERINVHALSVDAAGTLRLVADNPLLAAGTLQEAQYAVEQRDVLFVQVPNDPGALQSVARLLADTQVNIDYLYASALEDDVKAVVVAGVEDAQRAAMQAGL